MPQPVDQTNRVAEWITQTNSAEKDLSGLYQDEVRHILAISWSSAIQNMVEH